jgi:hypothetical protein
MQKADERAREYEHPGGKSEKHKPTDWSIAVHCQISFTIGQLNKRGFGQRFLVVSMPGALSIFRYRDLMKRTRPSGVFWPWGGSTGALKLRLSWDRPFHQPVLLPISTNATRGRRVRQATSHIGAMS